MKKRKLKFLAIPLAVASASVIGMVSGTLAYFTSQDKASVSIEAGQVKIDMAVDGTTLKLFSLDVEQTTVAPEIIDGVETDVVHFENGGYAYIKGAQLVLKKVTPGDKVSFNVKVYNRSNVDIKYRLLVEYEDLVEGADPKDPSSKGYLSDALVATNLNPVSEWTTARLNTKDTAIVDRNITIELPKDAGNAYQNAETVVYINVEAQQYNKPVDTSHGYADSYQDDQGHWTHEVATAAQVEKIFADSALVDVTDPDALAEATTTTYKLLSDVDLSNATTLGTGTLFGTLDGDGHIIKNADVSGSNYAGVFGKYFEGATVKNVTLRNVHISGNESVGLLFGASYSHAAGGQTTVEGSTLTLENIIIEDSCLVEGTKGVGGLAGSTRYTEKLIMKNVVNDAEVFAYNWNAGGFVGTLTGVKEIEFENCVNNGRVFGTKNVAGFVGHSGSATKITLKNCVNNGEVVLSNLEVKGGGNGGFFVAMKGTNAVLSYTDCEVTAPITYKQSTGRDYVLARVFEKDYVGNGINVAAGKTYNDFIVENSLKDFSVAKSGNNFNASPVDGAVRYTVTMFMYGRLAEVEDDTIYVIRETSIALTKQFADVNSLMNGIGVVSRAGYFVDDSLTNFDYRPATSSDNATKYGRAWFFRIPTSVAPTVVNEPYKDPSTGEWFYVHDAASGNLPGVLEILSPKDTYVNYIFSAFDADDELIATNFLEFAPSGAGSYVKNLTNDAFDIDFTGNYKDLYDQHYSN